MTYQEWAEEYKESAALLKQRTDHLKKQMITAHPSELRDLQFRFRIMHQMYLDCLSTASLLGSRKGGSF